jgi:hypothetical protein
LKPTPTFQTPLVTLKSALSPTAVLSPPQPPSDGQPASSAGESASQQSAISRIKKPQHKGERLVEVIIGRVFILFRFHLLGLSLWQKRKAGKHGKDRCEYCKATAILH